MATTFRHADGSEVARRSFGGDDRGTVVELLPGAADVSMTTQLHGDDGSTETLESLAQAVGRGRWPAWASHDYRVVNVDAEYYWPQHIPSEHDRAVVYDDAAPLDRNPRTGEPHPHVAYRGTLAQCWEFVRRNELS